MYVVLSWVSFCCMVRNAVIIYVLAKYMQHIWSGKLKFALVSMNHVIANDVSNKTIQFWMETSANYQMHNTDIQFVAHLNSRFFMKQFSLQWNRRSTTPHLTACVENIFLHFTTEFLYVLFQTILFQSMVVRVMVNKD